MTTIYNISEEEHVDGNYHFYIRKVDGEVKEYQFSTPQKDYVFTVNELERLKEFIK